MRGDDRSLLALLLRYLFDFVLLLPMEPEPGDVVPLLLEPLVLGNVVEPAELELGDEDEPELELGDDVLPEAPLELDEPCFAK